MVLNYEAVDRQSRSCCIIADRLHSGLSSLQFCCEVIYHLRIAGDGYAQSLGLSGTACHSCNKGVPGIPLPVCACAISGIMELIRGL